jgi:hypothetical protein
MYYPKSQIKPNLYTSKTDNNPLYLDLSATNLYIGYYYETSNGSKFTGKFPGDGNNQKLYPYPTPLLLGSRLGDDDYFISSSIVVKIYQGETVPQDDEDLLTIDLNLNYSNLKNSTNNNQNRFLPQYYTPFPTPQETQQGSIIRYFCKKGNEYRYIEINKETYNKLFSQDKTVAWDLYTPISLQWSTVSNTSYPPTSYFENQLGWVGFSRYVKPLKTPTTIQPK